MTNDSEPVTIRNIDVPFWRIVMILIKWSIAAIPAAIVVGIIYALILLLLSVIGVSVFEWAGIPIPEIPTPPAP
jgi:ABC-type sugar transport system permease subunit